MNDRNQFRIQIRTVGSSMDWVTTGTIFGEELAHECFNKTVNSVDVGLVDIRLVKLEVKTTETLICER